MNGNCNQHVSENYLDCKLSAKNVGYPVYCIAETLKLSADVITDIQFRLEIHVGDFYRLSNTPSLGEIIQLCRNVHVNLFTSAKILRPFEDIPVQGMSITFENSGIVCLVNFVRNGKYYFGVCNLQLLGVTGWG